MTYNAEYYYLDVATDAGFTSFVSGYENKIVTGTAHEVTGLDDNTAYYYRIRAKLPYNTTANGNTISVTTERGFENRFIFSEYSAATKYYSYSCNNDGSDRQTFIDITNERLWPTYCFTTQKIAFMRKIGSYWQIFVSDADGSNETQITNNSYNSYYPSFNYDGTKIVCSAYQTAKARIRTMDIDGTNVFNVTDGTVNLEQVRYNPSSDRSDLIMAVKLEGTDYRICTVNEDGTNFQYLTDTSALFRYPCWSLDGNYIYHSGRLKSGETDSKIRKMDYDGSNSSVIYNTQGDYRGLAFINDNTLALVHFTTSGVATTSVIKTLDITNPVSLTEIVANNSKEIAIGAEIRY